MSESTNTTRVPSSARSLVAAALIPLTFCGCQVAAMGQNAQGTRLYQQGQYFAAMQEFQKAAESDPTNADAFYNMAATLHQMGTQQNDANLLSQAETMYNQCLDIDANHVDCYRGLAVLLAETNREDRAFALLKNWVTRSPTLADPRIELARLYEEFGDLETASMHLHDAVQVDENNPRAWAALGHLRENMGDHFQALANYQRSFSLDNMQPRLAERIAVLNRAVTSTSMLPASGNTQIVTAPTSTRY